MEAMQEQLLTYWKNILWVVDLDSVLMGIPLTFLLTFWLNLHLFQTTTQDIPTNGECVPSHTLNTAWRP